MKVQNWFCEECEDGEGGHHFFCEEVETPWNGYPAIIVDLDGTLADIEHRRHYVEGDEKHFGKFHNDIPDDTVNNWCRNIISRFRGEEQNTTRQYNVETPDFAVILVTGRMAHPKTVKDTIEWLDRNNIAYDELHMRPNEDYTPDDELKKRIYNEELKDRFDVKFAVDDRKRVVDMWRDIGLTCLQCKKGDF